MIKIILSKIILLLLISCSNSTDGSNEETGKNGKPKILIETDFGNMEVILYDETPLHRDNFLKLTSDGYFNGLLFHRVIENFMIQGGDPSSKKGESAELIGSGGPGYTIPAEINDSLIHKKGVIAAARKEDNVNPEKKSSGSQFYIVQGTIFTDEQLDLIEKQNNKTNLQTIFSEIFEEKEIKYLAQDKEPDYNKIYDEARNKAEEKISGKEPFRFSEKARETYKTIGGTPHLDGSYTVFGEVVSGIDVIDKIASVEVDSNNKPLNDIKMKISLTNK